MLGVKRLGFDRHGVGRFSIRTTTGFYTNDYKQ
jgi:hypothetical protein